MIADLLKQYARCPGCSPGDLVSQCGQLAWSSCRTRHPNVSGISWFTKNVHSALGDWRLKIKGSWLYFGPFGFLGFSRALRFSREEVLEIVRESGFALGCERLIPTGESGERTAIVRPFKQLWAEGVTL